MADLYKINKKISQGAFGTVYEGVNVKTGEIVAIK
jgi:serine/threonine protein kinase